MKKTVLILVNFICAIGLIVTSSFSIFMIDRYNVYNYFDDFRMADSYINTKDFSENFIEYLASALDYIKYIEKFETDGELDYNKDIVEIYKKNNTVITYTLRDILNYSNDSKFNYYYSYQRYFDSLSFLYNNNSFLINNYDLTGEYIVNYPVKLVVGYNKNLYYENTDIMFFQFREVKEDEKINQSMKLNELYLEAIVRDTLSDLAQYEYYKDLFKNTNFKFYIQNKNNLDEVYTNSNKNTINNFEYNITYDNKNVSSSLELDNISNDYINSISQKSSYIFSIIKNSDESEYLMKFGIDTTYPIKDIFQTRNVAYENFSDYFILFIFTLIICLIGFIGTMLVIVMTAGHKKNYDGIYLNKLDKVWTDVFTVILLFIMFVFAEIIFEINNISYIVDFLIFIIALIFEYIVSFIMFYSFVKRFKAGQVLKNALCFKVLKVFLRQIKKLNYFILEIFRNLKITIKVGILFIGFGIINLIGFVCTYSLGVFFLFLLFLCYIVLFFIVVKYCIAEQIILDGTKKIASGDINYKIELNILNGDKKELADTINNIGDGLKNAIDMSIKDERMKTELITNVSHDIKTPLTSIINYVDLLKREKIDNDKVKEYLEILDNKSQRLKQLTEDLVEVSKANSGNIELNFENIDLKELIIQTNGEFEEKFLKKQLNLITNLPSQKVIINADGRRLWRVFENLYGNVSKYAMPNTRVYVDLTIIDDKVKFSIKNISEYPLNIDADELTERFIRGDVSRSTEGSGLGLSIAQSFTELLGGSFKIHLDGDLFKVEIMFNILLIENENKVNLKK